MIGTVVKFITETKALEVLGLKVKKKKTLNLSAALTSEHCEINVKKRRPFNVDNQGPMAQSSYSSIT